MPYRTRPSPPGRRISSPRGKPAEPPAHRGRQDDRQGASAPSETLSPYVYGRHVVALLLQRHPKRAQRLVVLAHDAAQGADEQPSGVAAHSLAALAALARKLGVSVQHAARSELDALCEGGVHQGAAICAAPFAYADLDGLCTPPAPGGAPLVVVLDQVQDPRNLGALMRSALAFGATGVLIPKDRAAAMTPAAMKVSAGAGLVLPLAQATNLRRALGELDERGLWVTGLCASGDKTIRDIEWTLPSALVVGAEGHGLRPLTRKGCHHVAAIEAVGMESLNVATAGAIALYEAARQRQRLTSGA